MSEYCSYLFFESIRARLQFYNSFINSPPLFEFKDDGVINRGCEERTFHWIQYRLKSGNTFSEKIIDCKRRKANGNY